MDKNIIIRKAKLEDACNIAMLKIQVWLHTYAIDGIESEYAEYLNAEITKEKTEAIIINSQKQLFLAEKEGRIIGCYQLDFDTSCPVNEIQDPELSVLYLSPHFQGKGIGKELLLHVEAELKQAEYSSLWLTAYHENKQAIDFYKRQNYLIKGKCYFEMGNSKYENWVFWKSI